MSKLPLPLRAAKAVLAARVAGIGAKAGAARDAVKGFAKSKRVRGNLAWGTAAAATGVGVHSAVAGAIADADKANEEKRKAIYGVRKGAGLGALRKADERDNRLVQPAQLAGGAVGGALGGYAGAKLGQRIANKPAAAFGQRMGARFRLASMQTRRFSKPAGAAGAAGASFAEGVARRQAHLVSRIARVGMRGGLIGGAAFGASMLGDYAGDWAARRVMGVRGKSDEYRNQGIMGSVLGGALGVAGQMAAGRARWARRLTQFRRGKLAVGAGLAGAGVGETVGNIADAKYSTGSALLGSDRRLVRSVQVGRLAKFFDESKVARDEDGKFAPKGGSKMTGAAPRPRHVASIYARGPQWEDRPKAEYDWARSVRPTKDMPFGVRQAYAAYRGELDRNPPPAPKVREEIALQAPDLADLPVTGRFKEITRKPQIPSTMTEKEWVDLGRWAKERLTSERDAQILRSIGRKDPGGHKNRIMIPVGTDPKDKDVRLAFNVARDLAMHDVGLYAYDHKMTPETIQALSPLRDYIKHTRRYLGDILRREKKGTWGAFRDEFGTEFKDGRTRRFDTQSGGKVGEKKKAFARHMHFLKAVQGGGLAKALTEAQRQQRIDAARRSAEARSRARQRPTNRSFDPPGKGYAPIGERHPSRAAATRVLATDERLRNTRASYTQPGLMVHDGVFTRAAPLSAEDAAVVEGINRKLKAMRPVATKARMALRGRDALSEKGPRWRYVGLDPQRWAPVESLTATPADRVFTGAKRQPPASIAAGTARAASRFGGKAKIAGAVAGAAALAGAAYGLGRWQGSRKAA